MTLRRTATGAAAVPPGAAAAGQPGRRGLSRGRGRLQSEKDTVLAQKLGQPLSFIAVFPHIRMGKLASFGPT